VGERDLLHDVEPEAESLCSRSRAGTGLERLEQRGNDRRRDVPVIVNRDDHRALRAAELHRHRLPLYPVAKRVADQIERICPTREPSHSPCRSPSYASSIFASGSVASNSEIADFAMVSASAGARSIGIPPLSRARVRIEQLVDDLDHAQAAGLEPLHGLLHRRIRGLLSEHGGRHQDDVQRVSKVVSDDCHQLFIQAQGRGQRLLLPV